MDDTGAVRASRLVPAGIVLAGVFGAVLTAGAGQTPGRVSVTAPQAVSGLLAQ